MRVKLCSGLGKLGESHCVMAATALLNGEEFTDTPECVSPAIAGMLISLNDRYYDPVDSNDPERDLELGGLPWLIIGTREQPTIAGTAILQRRMSWMLNVMFPMPHNRWQLLLVRNDNEDVAVVLNHVLDFVDSRYAICLERYVSDQGKRHEIRSSMNMARRMLVRALTTFPPVWYACVRQDPTLTSAVVAVRDFMRDITNAYREMVRYQTPLNWPAAEAGHTVDGVADARRELISCLVHQIVPMYTTATSEPSFEERIKSGKVPNLFLVE